jgi:GAF domain-containing protein
VTLTNQEEEILKSLAGLGDVLTSHRTLDGTLRSITELALELVRGADHAGISLAEGGPIETKGSTDTIAGTVDAIQHKLGEGPCLESIEQDDMFRVDNLHEDDRWPRFAAEVVAQTPVRSILAVVLDLGRTSIGALNLYADKAAAFEDDDQAVAAIFAAQAAVTLAATKQRVSDEERIENLRQALSTRDVIGQAKGILMARENCTDEMAFGMLSAASQRLNVKLREIAQLVVDDVGSDATQR